MTELSTNLSEVPKVISVENLSKRFVIHQDKSLKDRLLHPRLTRQYAEDFWALQDLTFDIYSGNTIGLIGPNGSGKSTLLKVIGGILAPTSGRVQHRGRIAALLELGAGFHQELTGRENVFLNAAILGLSVEETEARFDSIVEFSGIEKFIDTQVKFYSSGMYVRLAFAVAVHCDPDILLVDEVLAVGDEAFQAKCLNKIREFQEEGRTIIMVTHTLGHVAEFCTRALVLGQGKIVFDGDPTTAIEILRDGFRSVEDVEEVRQRAARQTALAEAEAERRALGRIEDVSLTLSSDPLTPGGSIGIDVALNVIREFPSWNLGVSIANSLGQVAVMTTSSRAGLGKSPLPSGRSTVHFDLPDLALTNGTYHVSVALFDENNAEIHRLENAAEFAAKTDARSMGLQYTRASATVQGQ